MDTFISGINSTIFAYGITGAGKSHTMFGGSDDFSEIGLIDHSLEYICSASDVYPECKISMSYM